MPVVRTGVDNIGDGDRNCDADAPQGPTIETVWRGGEVRAMIGGEAGGGEADDTGGDADNDGENDHHADGNVLN